MFFAIVLGIVVGGAGVLLIQQWLTSALVLGRSAGPALSPAQFPHLAPPGPRRRVA